MKKMRSRALMLLWTLTAMLAAVAATVRAEETAPPPDPRQEAVVAARKLLTEGRFRAAEEGFQRAAGLGEGPCFDCLVGLAGAYNGTGRFDQAITTARQALEMPVTPSRLGLAYNELGCGLALKSEKNYGEAETHLRKAIEVGQDSVTVARYNLSELLRRQKRYAESAEMARSYLSVDPEGQKSRQARIVLCRSASQPGVKRPDPEPAVRLADQPALQPPPRVFATRVSLGTEDWVRAKGTHLRANVLLEMLVDSEGCVRDVKVLEGPHNDIEKHIVEEAKAWVYKPLVTDGKPVASRRIEKFDVNIK